jgi:hypothetical protein
MPLSAPEARTKIKKQITVEMPVKAAKSCQGCSSMFLDSEDNHHDPKNFAVAVTKSGRIKFKETKIDDPAGYFKGYEFIVQPRLAGHGPTLFAGLWKHVDLKLLSRLEFVSGAVAMRYEPRR